MSRLWASSTEPAANADYKTEDGGKTWKNILSQLDNKTGAIDIAMSPANPDLLLVATWERSAMNLTASAATRQRRFPGERTIRAQRGTWSGECNLLNNGRRQELYQAQQGLAKRQAGRVGFDWSRKNPKTVFAIIETEKIGMGEPPRHTVASKARRPRAARE